MNVGTMYDEAEGSFIWNFLWSFRMKFEIKHYSNVSHEISNQIQFRKLTPYITINTLRSLLAKGNYFIHMEEWIVLNICYGCGNTAIVWTSWDEHQQIISCNVCIFGTVGYRLKSKRPFKVFVSILGLHTYLTDSLIIGTRATHVEICRVTSFQCRHFEVKETKFKVTWVFSIWMDALHI